MRIDACRNEGRNKFPVVASLLPLNFGWTSPQSRPRDFVLSFHSCFTFLGRSSGLLNFCFLLATMTSCLVLVELPVISAMTSAPQPFPLLRLPLELREQVYFHLFSWSESTIHIASKHCCWPNIDKPMICTEILRSCQQLRKESSPTLMAALANTKLYVWGQITDSEDLARRFLVRFGSSFQYVKTRAVDINRLNVGDNLLAGMKTLEVKFGGTTDWQGRRSIMRRSGHGHGEDPTVHQAASFEDIIWASWDRSVPVLVGGGCLELFRLLDSKLGEGRNFHLKVSTTFKAQDGSMLVSLRVFPQSFC